MRIRILNILLLVAFSCVFYANNSNRSRVINIDTLSIIEGDTIEIFQGEKVVNPGTYIDTFKRDFFVDSISFSLDSISIKHLIVKDSSKVAPFVYIEEWEGWEFLIINGENLNDVNIYILKEAGNEKYNYYWSNEETKIDAYCA